MKLIETASLLLPSAMAGANFDNLYAQHRSLSTANHLVKKLNMITERRIFPELVSTNEGGFTSEQRDEYEGHYAMEQPNVNFLLDFGNEELVKFRIHSQTYQQKTSYLDQNGWGAKKSGSMGWGDSAVEDDGVREEDQWYKDYQANHIERFTRPTRANLLRRIASQEMMIQYVSKSKRRFGAFFNYGCHCFPGSFIDPRHSPHAMPVDDIDKACREHSWAYDCAKQDFGTDCRGKYQLYNWIGTINSDGYTHDISCTDEENTCSWAICQADKHLATRLSELPYEYRADFLVTPQESGINPFDRVQECNLQAVEDTSRDSHNNNENVYLNDYTQQATGPVSNEPSAPQMIAQSAAGPAFPNEPAFPSVPIQSPADLDASRGINGVDGFGSFGAMPVDGSFPDSGMPGDVSGFPSAPANQPNWGAMTLEERRKWADAYGLDIPEEFKEPKVVEEYVYQPGNIQFGSVPSGSNQVPQFADAVADASENAGNPAFTHASTEAPATDADLNNALEQVADVASQVNGNQLYADDANNYMFDDNLPMDGPDRAVNGAPLSDSPATSSVSEPEQLPEVVMKSAVTHHYRQCCGQYPTRYKFSTKRMGCCNDNGIERLYNPSNAKCCHVKSARGVSGSMASYLARSLDDCEDAFNN